MVQFTKSDTKEKFVKAKGALEKSFKSKKALSNLLIVPVQRIPRYKMLLTDIARNTWEDHEDYQNLMHVVDRIENIATKADRGIVREANLAKLVEIQKKVRGLPKEYETLVSEGRVFLLEGALSKSCRKTTKRRRFFLFSDILLYGPDLNVGGYYKVNKTLLVKNCAFSEQENNDRNYFLSYIL